MLRSTGGQRKGPFHLRKLLGTQRGRTRRGAGLAGLREGPIQQTLVEPGWELAGPDPGSEELAPVDNGSETVGRVQGPGNRAGGREVDSYLLVMTSILSPPR